MTENLSSIQLSLATAGRVRQASGSLVLILITVLLIGCGEEESKRIHINDAPEDLSIGRMRVSIWPEYDDQGVLAVYDGKFNDASSFPLKTSFLVPKGAIINDACSLSFEGQHFCQLYKTIDRGIYDEVRLLLPYPNFYLSFHTPPIDTGITNRSLDYRIKASHPIETMEVDIQQPLRSTGFNSSPVKNAAASMTIGKPSEAKGYNHYPYTLKDVTKGGETLFNIRYQKSDPNPSVDIKYATMTEPKVWGSPYETQRNAKTIVYILFGSSTLGLMIIVIGFVLFRKRKRRAGLE